MSTLIENLNTANLSAEKNAFKNLRKGAIFGKKIKVADTIRFTREDILRQIGGYEEFEGYRNDFIDIVLTLENNEVFVYLDSGINGGGTGGSPRGVAKSPAN